MDKSTAPRSYLLPAKLLAAFNKECDESGYVRNKAVVAAILAFLDSDRDVRAKMFGRLESFVGGKVKYR